MLEVYKDAITKDTLKALQEQIVGSLEMPWYYIQSSAYSDHPGVETEVVDQGSFFHLAFDKDLGPSHLADICLKALYEAAVNIEGIGEYNVTRIRIGMHVWGSSRIVNTPHVDSERPHIVGLLYLNNSDGDTRIYEESFDSSANMSAFECFESVSKFTEKVTVSPVAGTFVLFDGKHYHSSSTPTEHANRVTINFNLEK